MQLKAFDYQPDFKRTVLKNGVRIVTEHHPSSRGVAVGYFIDSGTRDEPTHLNGAAHFIEHLVFKGTKKRNAFQIASALEEVGGDLNAYTSREYTCFHSVSLKEHLSLSLDILTDLICDANFSAEDYFKELQVILQEIDTSADQLEDYIFDMYFESAYKKQSLGTPILGTRKSLESMKRLNLQKFYKDLYRGKNLIVSVAGRVDHDEVVREISTRLGEKSANSLRPERKANIFKPFKKMVEKPAEQAHVLVGWPSCAITEKYRFEAYIVNSILGGGMTSRLYQSIREDKGWAYSVYSFLQAFTDTGCLSVYVGTSRDRVKDVLEMTRKELSKMIDKGIGKKELDSFKTQVLGQILLGADDMDNRMTSIAVNEMLFQEYRSVERVIEDIQKVSTESIRKYLDRYLARENFGVLLMGDVMTQKIEKALEKF